MGEDARAKFISIDDRDVVPLFVDGWPDVFMRLFTASEHAEMVEFFRTHEGDEQEIMSYLIASALCDENGDLLFSAQQSDDRQLLRTKSLRNLTSAFEKIMSHNGLTDDAMEAAEGKLNATVN